MGYRLEMVQELMESFDINAALLVRFSEFDHITLTVRTTFGDIDEQFDSVEADLRIDIKDGQRAWRMRAEAEWAWSATAKPWQ